MKRSSKSKELSEEELKEKWVKGELTDDEFYTQISLMRGDADKDYISVKEMHEWLDNQ